MKYEMVIMTGATLGRKLKVIHYNSETKIFDKKLNFSASVKYIEDYCNANGMTFTVNITGEGLFYHLVK